MVTLTVRYLPGWAWLCLPHNPPVQLQQSPLPVGTAQDPSQCLGVGLYLGFPALPLDVGRGPRIPPDHGR